MTEPTTATPSKQDTMTGCLLRFTWMAVGNLALFFLAMAIAQSEGWHPTWRDAALVAVALASIAVRFVDIRLFEGKDADGKPATMVDWRRYSVRLFAAAAGLWLLAHLVSVLGFLRSGDLNGSDSPRRRAAARRLREGHDHQDHSRNGDHDPDDLHAAAAALLIDIFKAFKHVVPPHIRRRDAANA